MAGPRDTIKARIALDGGEEIRRELEQLGAVGEAAFAKLQRASEQFKGPNLTAAQTGLKQLALNIGEVASQLTSLGAKFTAVGAATEFLFSSQARGFFTDAVKGAGDFEAAVNNLKASSQATGTEIDQMTQKALELSKTWAKSPQEIAKSMEELAKNGVGIKDVLGGAEDAVIKLARANDGQLGPAATLVSDVLKQFRLDVSQLPEVVDQTTGALLASKGEFQEFQLAISQSGQVAASTGVSYKEFITALAETAPAFAAGSDAGTSFKTFLLRLNPTTKEATQHFKDLGFSAYDTATKKLKPMAQIIRDLQTAFNGLSEQDRRTKLTEAFGTDAIRTVDALLRLTTADLKRFDDAISNTSAAKVAKDRMAGYNFEIQKFDAAMERLKISIGNSGILSDMTKLVDKVSDLVDQLAEGNPTLLKFIAYFTLAVGVIGPVVTAIGLFLLACGQIGKAVGGVVRAFGFFVAEGGAVEAFLGRFALIPRLILGPWGLLAIALFSYWDDIKQGAKDFYNALFGDQSKVQNDWIAGWTAAMIRLKDAFVEFFSGDFGEAWKSFKQAGTDAWNALKDQSTGTFGALLRDALFCFAAIKAAAIVMGNEVAAAWLGSMAGAIWGTIAAAARGLLFGAFADLLLWPLAFITAGAVVFLYFPELEKAAQSAFKTIGAAAKELGTKISEALGRNETLQGNLKLMGTAWDGFAADVNKAIDEMEKGYDDFLVWLQGQNQMALRQVQADWDTLKNALSGVGAFLKGQLSELADLGQAIDLHDWDRIKALLVKPFKDAKPEIEKALEEIGNAAQAVPPILAKAWQGFVTDFDGFTRELESEWDGFLSYMDGQNKLAVTQVQADWETLKGAFQGVSSFLKGQFAEIGDLASAIKTGDTAKIKELLAKPFTDARTAIKGELDGIEAENKGLLSKLQALWNGSGSVSLMTALSLAWRGAVKTAQTELGGVPKAAKDAIDKTRVEALEAKAIHLEYPWAEDAQAAMQGMLDAMNKMKAAGQTLKPAEDAGNRLVKVWNGAKDAVTEYQTKSQEILDNAPAIDPKADQIIKVWKERQKAAEDAGKASKKAGDDTADGAGKATDKIKETTFAAQEFKVGGTGAFSAVGEAAKKLAQVQEQFSIFKSIVAQAQAAKDGAIKEFEALPPEVAKRLEGLKITKEQFAAIPDEARKAIEAAGLQFQKLASGQIRLIDPAKVKDEYSVIPKLAADAVAAAKDGLKGVADPLKDIPKDAKAPLEETKSDAQRTAEAITKAFESIKGFDWKTLSEGSVSAFTTLTQAATGGKDALTLVGQLLDKLPVGATTAGTAFLTLQSQVQALAITVEAVLTTIEGRIKAVAAALQAISSTAPATGAPGTDAGTGAAATSPFAAIEQQAAEAFTRILEMAQQLAIQITDALAQVTVDWSGLSDAAQTAFSDLLAKAQASAQEIAQQFGQISIDWSSLTNGLDGILADILTAFGNFVRNVNSVLTEIAQAIVQIGTGAQEAASKVNTAANSMVANFHAVRDAANEAAAAAASIPSSGGGGGDNGASSDAGNGFFASGGPVRGKGSGTSDDILAWLSNGEYVQTAKATRFWGQGFMDAVRRMDMSKVKKMLTGRAFAKGGPVLPAFSQGGLASLLNRSMAVAVPSVKAPRFAKGGAVTGAGMHPVVIKIDGQDIPVVAGEDSIKRFGQVARRRAMVKAGRAPGWVGG
jgi:TP901 family phage tail tape measure protein